MSQWVRRPWARSPKATVSVASQSCQPRASSKIPVQMGAGILPSLVKKHSFLPEAQEKRPYFDLATQGENVQMIMVESREGFCLGQAAERSWVRVRLWAPSASRARCHSAVPGLGLGTKPQRGLHVTPQRGCLGNNSGHPERLIYKL